MIAKQNRICPRLFRQVRSQVHLAAAVLLLGLGQSLSASATPLFPPDEVLGSTPIYFFFPSGGISYDATTDLFSGQFDFLNGDLPSGTRIEASPGSILSFAAIVDETGHISSSSATLEGGIPDLGIPPFTTLVDALISGIGFADLNAGGAGPLDPVMQILMNVNLANPQLGLGPTIGFQQLSPSITAGGSLVTAATFDMFAANPFASSFTVGFTSFGDLVNVVAPVPEPGSLALLMIGLLALGFSRRRRARG